MIEVWRWFYQFVGDMTEAGKADASGWIGVLGFIVFVALIISILGWMFMPWIIRNAILKIKVTVDASPRIYTPDGKYVTVTQNERTSKAVEK